MAIEPSGEVDIRCNGTPDGRCVPWLGEAICTHTPPQRWFKERSPCTADGRTFLHLGHHVYSLPHAQGSALVDLHQDTRVDVVLQRPARLAAVSLETHAGPVLQKLRVRHAACSPTGSCRLFGMAPGRWRLVRDPSPDPWDDLYALDRVADIVVPEGGETLRISDPWR